MRQFWIDLPLAMEHLDSGSHDSQVHIEPYNETFSDVVHVIEYSAYESLKAELEVSKETIYGLQCSKNKETKLAVNLLKQRDEARQLRDQEHDNSKHWNQKYGNELAKSAKLVEALKVYALEGIQGKLAREAIAEYEMEN